MEGIIRRKLEEHLQEFLNIPLTNGVHAHPTNLNAIFTRMLQMELQLQLQPMGVDNNEYDEMENKPDYDLHYLSSADSP